MQRALLPVKGLTPPCGGTALLVCFRLVRPVQASDALFSLARAAFQAGWLAAGGREAQPERIFTVLRPEADTEKP